MIRRILASALIAGVITGLSVGTLQSVTTTPLILEAERYEGGATPAVGVTGARGLVVLVHGPAETHDDGSGPDARTVPGGVERTLSTMTTAVGASAGFALVLLGLMLLAEVKVAPRAGVIWGAAAFAATGLATALGIAPELPGSAAADLLDRQLWWLGTALATGGALWLALRVATPPALAAALVLVAAPHFIGAPQPDALTSTAPAELAGQFAAASLVLQAISWVMAGALVGYVWQATAGRDPSAR